MWEPADAQPLTCFAKVFAPLINMHFHLGWKPMLNLRGEGPFVIVVIDRQIVTAMPLK